MLVFSLEVNRCWWEDVLLEIANHIDVTDERRTYKHPDFCAITDADRFESDLSNMACLASTMMCCSTLRYLWV